MSTLQISIIVVLAIAILAVIVSAVMKNMKPKTKPAPTPAPATPGTPVVSSGGAIDVNKILKKGMSGPEVTQLQTVLKEKGQNIAIDGQFGAQTEAALIAVAGVNQITLAALANVGTSSGNSGGGLLGNVLQEHNQQVLLNSLYEWCGLFGAGYCYPTEIQCGQAYGGTFGGTCTRYLK